VPARQLVPFVTALCAQVPPSHAATVHSLPSLPQRPTSFVYTHALLTHVTVWQLPPAAQWLACVHGTHAPAPSHTPVEHVVPAASGGYSQPEAVHTAFVHSVPPVHSVLSGVNSHSFVARLHVSTVQALLSLHSPSAKQPTMQMPLWH
jgi:hypothetical protein